MNQVIIPENYHSVLSMYETQDAIGIIKEMMQKKLCMALRLKRVTVEINDIWDGNGENPTEREDYSISYKVTDDDWINYCFEIVEKKENELDTLVRVTEIEML